MVNYLVSRAAWLTFGVVAAALLLVCFPAGAGAFPRGGGASFQLNVQRNFNVGAGRAFAFRQRAFFPSYGVNRAFAFNAGYGYAQQQVFAAPVYQQAVVQQVVQVPVYQAQVVQQVQTYAVPVQTFQMQQQFAPSYAPSCGGAAFGLGGGCGAGGVGRSFSFGAGYGR